MNAFDLIVAGLAAVAGGLVNALAGGGTLITFPMLTALGVPPVAANVTNTVALCPGYLGATFAQVKDLRGQGQRLWFLMPAGVLGGIAGGILLLNTSDHTFRALVPYLILLAVVLLFFQDRLRNCKAIGVTSRYLTSMSTCGEVTLWGHPTVLEVTLIKNLRRHSWVM